MMNLLVNKTTAAVVMMALLFSISCSTTRLIQPRPDTVQNELTKGDIIKITVKNDRTLKLKIVAINPDAIVGDRLDRWDRKQGQEQILFTEITKIERTEVQAGKSIAATVAVVVILGLIVSAIYINNLDQS